MTNNEVLNKIKEEFIDLYPKNWAGEPEMSGTNLAFSLNQVLQVIDKYKADMKERKYDIRKSR